MAAPSSAHDHAPPLGSGAEARPVVLLAVDTPPPGRAMELGGLITVVSVHAANVVRDIRENIRNLVGGRMVHYERLIQAGVDAALHDLQSKACELGYDGVLGVKISHPTVVDGGVEVVVYGNGFRWVEAERTVASQAEQESSFD
jgi:uncharacterized protein YbjQ (UPF0145 family)